MPYSASARSVRILGGRIKEARLRAKLTQDELAEKWGKQQRAISEYESGKRQFGAAELLDLSEILDIPATFLFAGELRTANDQEAALIEWYRQLDDKAKDRVFKYLQFEAQQAPLVIGEQRDPARSTPDKGRRDSD